MKDYRLIFGYASIIFALGFLVRSIIPAHAQNGPNVSMGTNPIVFLGKSCNNTSASTVFTNNSSHKFIITDLVFRHKGYDIELWRDSTKIWDTMGGQLTSVHVAFNSGIPIEPGSSFRCKGGGTYVSVSGYYAH